MSSTRKEETWNAGPDRRFGEHYDEGLLLLNLALDFLLLVNYNATQSWRLTKQISRQHQRLTIESMYTASRRMLLVLKESSRQRRSTWILMMPCTIACRGEKSQLS